MKTPFLLLAIALAATVRAQNPDRIYQLNELKTATITAAGHKFKVWIMNTPTKRNEGMMFLKDKDVHIDQGMLFVFASEQPLSFWMRNTLIPLDIIYIKPDGTVLSIARTVPALDESPVPSGGRIRAVLELASGRAAQLGILPGDRIVHRIFQGG